MNTRKLLLAVPVLSGLATVAFSFDQEARFAKLGLGSFLREFDSWTLDGQTITVDDEYKDDKYILKITLPGFGLNDVKYSIIKEDEQQILKIMVKEKEKKSEGQGTTLRHQSIQQSYSSSVVNGRKEVKEKKVEQTFADNVHTIKIMLPDNVTKDVPKWQFKNDVLMLSFATVTNTKQAPDEIELSFSEETKMTDEK